MLVSISIEAEEERPAPLGMLPDMRKSKPLSILKPSSTNILITPLG